MTQGETHTHTYMITDTSCISMHSVGWEFESAQGDLEGHCKVHTYQVRSTLCIVDVVHYSSSLVFLPQTKIKAKKKREEKIPARFLSYTRLERI